MKPILFSTPMVQAILAGTKTMTRRAIKPQPGEWINQMGRSVFTPELWFSGRGCYPGLGPSEKFFKPKYWKGDILWVRETCSWLDEEPYGYVYRTDYPFPVDWNWKPSIFMPREACRLFLEVTNVKAERLKDISEDDAISEGVLEFTDGTFKNYFTKKGLKESDGVECHSAVASFQSLWHSINKEWNPDQWVWVYSFKRIDKPANFL